MYFLQNIFHSLEHLVAKGLSGATVFSRTRITRTHFPRISKIAFYPNSIYPEHPVAGVQGAAAP